ncbi:MAG: serine/threonine protein kinase [Tolypothrix brevis GSE-NOS-MK-07-07A]|nr:serine/threonine protein kinase [Tolypothrix brevis GSE-NOS-MK-07-07A]
MLTVAVTTWTTGYQLHNGKYTIEKVLAQGGFGITYLAVDENQERIVIKTLNETVQKRPDFAKLQQDFLNEAVKLAKCNHPHIVKVKEVFQEGKLWCMAMEYIQGEHFADRVVNRGVLSEAEAVGYIQQIGEALTIVHNNGLLHRDVKPANIIVRSNQREAVLIDFGIAREFVPSITQLHTPYLSHCFAPIEQYQSVAKRGAYTDVYALAATLYFLLTNRLPYPAINRASGMVLESPKSINLNISDRLNQAILKGMELAPENRPQTMHEWLELLKEPPTQSNTSSTTANVLKNKKFIYIMSSALIVMLAGLLIYYYITRKKPPSPFNQVAQDSSRQKSGQVSPDSSANQRDYFFRYDFSKFFPLSDSEFQIVSSEQTAYHLKFFMKKDVKIVAALSISDIEDKNPYPANFANITKKIAGYPAIVDINNTIILVGEFEVRVRSIDSSFTASDRIEWIQKFDLSGLSKCSIEVSDTLLKKCGVPETVDPLFHPNK